MEERVEVALHQIGELLPTTPMYPSNSSCHNYPYRPFELERTLNPERVVYLQVELIA